MQYVNSRPDFTTMQVEDMLGCNNMTTMKMYPAEPSDTFDIDGSMIYRQVSAGHQWAEASHTVVVFEIKNPKWNLALHDEEIRHAFRCAMRRLIWTAEPKATHYALAYSLKRKRWCFQMASTIHRT